MIQIKIPAQGLQVAAVAAMAAMGIITVIAGIVETTVTVILIAILNSYERDWKRYQVVALYVCPFGGGKGSSRLI